MKQNQSKLLTMDERNARLLQAVQMTSIGMSHMLLLAYDRISELEAQVEELKQKLEAGNGHATNS